MRKRRMTIALFEDFGRITSKEWITLLYQNGIKVMQVINKSPADLENFVKKAGTIPVLAGEDTTNPQVLSTALAKGAQGVFLKTSFATVTEAPTAKVIKAAMV